MPYPDIVVDDDAAVLLSLVPNRARLISEPVIAWNNHAMACDQDIISNDDAAMPIDNSEGIDAAFCSYFDPAAERKYTCKVLDFGVFADSDRSAASGFHVSGPMYFRPHTHTDRRVKLNRFRVYPVLCLLESVMSGFKDFLENTASGYCMQSLGCFPFAPSYSVSNVDGRKRLFSRVLSGVKAFAVCASNRFGPSLNPYGAWRSEIKR